MTPRMSRLVGDQETKSIVTSYIGELNFLDNQDAFDKIFGKNPMIVGTKPASDNNVSCMSCVRQYADNCLLDVFLDICRQDYVGRVDTNARKKLVHEICKSISDLLQIRKGPGGRNDEITPDALYAAYIGVIAGLSEDTSLWSITLCSSFFSALSPNLRDKIEEEDTFRMQAISGMSSRTKQLEGLRIVRLAAVKAYNKLNDKRDRMRRMMSELGKMRHGTHHQLEAGDRHTVDMRSPSPFSPPPPPYTSYQRGGETHYQSQSLAEQTLSQYSNGNRSDTERGTFVILTRKGQNGRDYPYNPANPSYLSKFPLGFRGCFKCGATDHWNRNSCPMGKSTEKELVNIFMHELVILKPKFCAQREVFQKGGMHNLQQNNQELNHYGYDALGK